MAIRAVYIGLSLALILLKLMSLVSLCSIEYGLKQQLGFGKSLKTSVFTSGASSVKCTLLGTPHLPAFSMSGDFLIGGVSTIHYHYHAVIYNYTTKPDSPRCTGSFNAGGLRISRTIIFAIEEINNSTELLPGITLGYKIFDSCISVPVSVLVAVQLLNGEDSLFYKGINCSHSGVVMGVVEDSGSTPSISMSRIFGSFNIPLVSSFSTCACLSDKQQFPAFFRTIPSDHYQADALAKLVKHFGWTWIGVVHSNSDYGNNGIASFLKAVLREGICVEYTESFFRTDPRSSIQRVADVIRRSTAKVVVAFTAVGDIKILLEELALDLPSPRQWIASEAWVTDPNLMSFSFCAGAIGVAIQRSVIPGLRDFLLNISPSELAASSVLTEFWEDAFNCKLSESEEIEKSIEDQYKIIHTFNFFSNTNVLDTYTDQIHVYY